MMAPVRKQKVRSGGAGVTILFFSLLMAAGAWDVGVRAATTERVVTDLRTGLAISGFDPVAYFTNARPTLGREDFESRFAGAIWRFSNPGNRLVFTEHPEVYMPAFGGYDPVGIARGVAVPGHPRVWLIVGTRLYLFHNDGTRAEFEAGPDAFILAASRQWSEVKRTLAE